MDIRFNLILVAGLLSSCSIGVQSHAITQVNPTNAPTRVMTSTSLPSPTATQSPVEKIFVIPTYLPYLDTTPTPIATPSLGYSSMQLRSASEANLLGLISDLQERSYGNFPPHNDWWSEGQFSSSQELVALAIQEYLYHFPDSSDSDRLRWQLAFIEAITFEDLKGNEYYDKWIVEQLEDKLNQGLVFPDDMNSFLDHYWFEVRYYQDVANLFGDQKSAWFYVIEPQVWEEEELSGQSLDSFDRGGLFVVIREISQGKFEVYILENGWNFSSGSSSLFEISDFNQNGVPEIALNIRLHSGSICGGNLKIFEWSGNAFADLTGGNIQVHDCSDNYEYAFVAGKPSIRFEQLFKPAPSVYTWNGTYYEFSRYEYSNLVEKWWSARSPSEEAEAIEEILTSKNMEGLSPAHIDFLRYRLGIVYALDSQESQAKQVLQDLVDHPSDKTRTIYSEFSKNFLKYYSGDENLYIACRKSREILDKADKDLSSEEEEKLFGVLYDNNFGSGVFGIGLLRCFGRDVFDLLINTTPVNVKDVPGLLRNNGVKLYYAEKQDVNLDGSLEEWLIIIDDGVFVVLPDTSTYKAIEIQYFWYGENTSKYSNVSVDIARWGGIQDPVLRISAGQDMDILSVSKDYVSTWLNSEYDMKNVVFSVQDNPARFEVTHIKPSPDASYLYDPWTGYRWDSAHEEFKEDLFEYTVFIERDLEKSSGLAEKLLPMLDDWKDLSGQDPYFPRYYYFSALSYELAGNNQKAAEIYWQLWHDFPGSEYALLAKFKLETTTR